MPARLLDFMKRPAVVVAISVLILRGLTLASRFLLSLLLAQMLSPEEMGRYGLITAVLAFALLGLGLEFYSYTYREMVPASPSRRAQIIADQAALGALTFLAVVILSLLAVLADLFPARLVPWFLVILATEHISLEATRFLVIMSRPVRAYMVVFLRGAVWVYAIAILMLTVPSSRSLESVLVWWALGGASSIAFAAVAVRDLPWRELRNRWPDRDWIQAGLRIARPFMLTAAGALTITYVDRFFIDKFSGREALGIYTFYSTIAIGMLSLGASVSHQFLPKVIAAYASGPEAYRASLHKFFWSLCAITVGMIVLAALAMWPMLVMFGLSTYLAGIWAFYLMLPGVLFRILADVPAYALYAARSDSHLLFCNLGAALVSALLNILLVPSFGINGAALTNGVASAVLFFSMAYLAVLKMREHRRVVGAAATANTPPDPDMLYP
ncbi:MAG: polysaccharide biosynthesis C-terminal domain-containing protein [Bradyrhizobium sp.]